MVLAVEGVAPTAVRAMPSCISAGTWNAERLWHQPWPAVETDLGAEAGVRMVDGREVPKHGRHWAGVRRKMVGNGASGRTARPVCGWAMAVPRATRGWDCGMVPKCSTARGAGQNAQSTPSRRGLGVGAPEARTGVEVAAAPRDGGAEDLPVPCPRGHPFGDTRAEEWEAVAQRHRR